MNYSETIQFLNEQFPCFQHVGQSAYVPSLQNIKDLLSYLGNPEQKVRCIHVAGTNGKGSTSHFCASILQESGYKVGLYTSPHIIDFSERIRVNGQNITKQYVISFIKKHSTKLKSLHASLFEVTTAMAFDYFANQNVDLAVIEVGLGGRLDSTNIITPLVSVITNIGFDHTQILGDTLAKIAREKAGIIKPNVPVVIGEWHKETAPVFEEVASNNESCILFASEEYTTQIQEKTWSGKFDIYNKNNEIQINTHSGLLGEYQKKNIVTVYTVIQVLQNIGLNIPTNAIKRGFKNVIKNTNLLGRWQIISKKPLVICDTGHNYDGISYTMPQLLSLNKKDIRIVWGMVGDKDIDSIQTLLPDSATYYLCKPSIERAMPIERLEGYFQKKKHKTYKNISAAFLAAKHCATNDSVIYVGGSSYVVAEFLSKFL